MDPGVEEGNREPIGDDAIINEYGQSRCWEDRVAVYKRVSNLLQRKKLYQF